MAFLFNTGRDAGVINFALLPLRTWQILLELREVEAQIFEAAYEDMANKKLIGILRSKGCPVFP
jgi:hypothetical protein